MPQDKVEIWEAVLTLLFFPILVIIAYTADKGWLNVIFCQVRSGIISGGIVED